MKAINKVCQILAIVSGLAALALFFTNFAQIVYSGNTISASGAQLAFGTEIAGIDMHKSSKLLFCLLVTVLTVVLSFFSIKKKGARYAAVVSSAVVAIFMLVVALSSPFGFVDADGVTGVTAINYTFAPLTIACVLFGTLATSIAFLLIDDYIECAGKKPTIIKRFVQFIRDYRSEAKKIVWPGLKDVVKNTIIVLIMCVIVGAFIWLVDFGLSNLLSLIW